MRLSGGAACRSAPYVTGMIYTLKIRLKNSGTCNTITKFPQNPRQIFIFKVTKMLKFNKLFLAAFVTLTAASAFGQKTAEKPMNKWSKEDAIAIMTDSPWATTYQSPQGSAAATAADLARQQADNRMTGAERGSIPRSGGAPPVVIRLFSAMPMRQAQTRLNQIASKYDKMDEKGKAEFDAASAKYLQCPICQNYYVVTLTQFSDSSGQFIEEGLFQGMTLEQMKGNVWLANEKGERRDLVQFTPPQKRGDPAVFFFARKDDKGNVLIAPSNTRLDFVFSYDFLSPSNRYSKLVPHSFEFKVSKMMVGDTLMF